MVRKQWVVVLVQLHIKQVVDIGVGIDQKLNFVFVDVGVIHGWASFKGLYAVVQNNLGG